ncbi:MAG TPA: hypothetical protein EYN91_05960 [Candidatus Melainabacteria bacterium]|jgi:hypothetical protein|nr:hypothetical protein [Candidatus Melainabacteria bacterium]HIN67607.1 hypothetical protein [Candidatus Obscuribacterales bacterium]
MKKSASKNSKEPKQSGDSSENKTLLGQILVELGYITIYQLDEALQIQREDNAKGLEQKALGQILLELGYCGPNQLIRGIQVQSEYRKVAPSED